MLYPTDPHWWRVRIGKVPVIEGLRPLLGLDAEHLRLLHALDCDPGIGIAVEDLVPKVGQVTTIDLGRDPSYFSPAELLAIAGLPNDDAPCTLALPDLHLPSSWSDPERWTTGLVLTRLFGQAFLFDTTLSAWHDVLIGRFGHPNLILCTKHRWALGLDNDTGDCAAVARW